MKVPTKGWYSPVNDFYSTEDHAAFASSVIGRSNDSDSVEVAFENLATLLKHGWLRINEGGKYIQVAKWDQKTINLLEQFLSEFNIKEIIHLDIGSDPTKITRSVNYSL